MPGRDFYRGLSLEEALRTLADHHFESENRHISKFEYQLLLRAADLIKSFSGFKAKERTSRQSSS